MSDISLLISVDRNYLERLPEVADKLQIAGFKVKDQLDEIGIITGSISSDKVQPLSAIEGVSSVEREEIYELAPQDSKIQ